MSDVLFKKPDGEFVYVDSSEAQSASDRGYAPATPEQLEASKHPVAAAASGALAGALPYLGTQIAVKANQSYGLSEQEARQLERDLKEQNPIASSLGTGAGFVLGAPGRVIGAARAALGVSGLLGGAVASFVEGGAMGVNDAVNESIIDNTPVTADRIAAHAIPAALTGGAVDFGLGAAGKLVSPLISKTGGTALKDSLNDMALKAESRQLLESSGNALSKLEKRGGSMEDVVNIGRANGLIDENAAMSAEHAARIDAVMKEHGARRGRIFERVDEVVPLQGSGRAPAETPLLTAGEGTANLRAPVAEPEMVGGPGTVNLRAAAAPEAVEGTVNLRAPAVDAAAAEETALRPGKYVSEAQANANRQEFLSEVERRIRNQFKGRHILSDDVDKFVENEVYRKLGKVENWDQVMRAQEDLRKAVEAGAAPARKEIYDVGRKAIRDVAFDTAESLGADMPARLRGIQKEYAALAFLKDVTEKRAARLESTGGPLGAGLAGMLSAMQGGKVGAGVGAALGGAVGGPVGAAVGVGVGLAGNRILRERGGFLMGAALRKMADSSLLNGIAKGVQSQLIQRILAAPELLGTFRGALEEAVSQGPEAALQTHVMLAQRDPNYLPTLGMTPETPEQIEGIGQKLAAYDALHQVAQAQKDAVDSAVDGLFGATPGRKGVPGGSISSKDFSAAMENIRNVIRNPEQMYQNIPQEIQGAAPMTSGKVAASVVNAAKFLESKAPKNPYENMPPALQPKWEPDAVSLDRFARYKEAVENPSQVLKNLAQGYVSTEQVEAIKAVYPDMYQQLQQDISEKLVNWTKPLTFQQKLAFSKVLGTTVLAPSQQQWQILQEAQSSAGVSGGKGGKPPDGRQVVDQEKNLRTQSQRLEAR